MAKKKADKVVKAESTDTPKDKPETSTEKTPVLSDVSGKQYRGQAHYALHSEAQRVAHAELQKRYRDAKGVSLTTYFALKGVNHAVQQAMMKAFTPVRSATMDGWEEIFRSY